MSDDVMTVPTPTKSITYRKWSVGAIPGFFFFLGLSWVISGFIQVHSDLPDWQANYKFGFGLFLILLGTLRESLEISEQHILTRLWWFKMTKIEWNELEGVREIPDVSPEYMFWTKSGKVLSVEVGQWTTDNEELITHLRAVMPLKEIQGSLTYAINHEIPLLISPVLSGRTDRVLQTVIASLAVSMPIGLTYIIVSWMRENPGESLSPFAILVILAVIIGGSSLIGYHLHSFKKKPIFVPRSMIFSRTQVSVYRMDGSVLSVPVGSVVTVSRDPDAWTFWSEEGRKLYVFVWPAVQYDLARLQREAEELGLLRFAPGKTPELAQPEGGPA